MSKDNGTDLQEPSAASSEEPSFSSTGKPLSKLEKSLLKRIHQKVGGPAKLGLYRKPSDVRTSSWLKYSQRNS